MNTRKYGNKKRVFVWALALCISICCIMPTCVQAAAPQTSASAYVLMEANSRRVLSAGNETVKLPMASTTKILTCILAIENGKLDSVVQVDDAAVGIEGSSMYLQYGETLTLEDLLYGLMLSSGNDAAVAIAIHIAGSVEAFAQMMNEKAAEIGAVNSGFVTPNGLSAEGHYTTAYDLALIASYGMQNDIFKEIVGTSSVDLPADDDSPARYLRSKNKVLYNFEGGNGIKTGYTKDAGKCFVGGAYRDGMQLVAVVLNDGAMFDDSMQLMEYGFSTYIAYPMCEVGEEVGEIAVENSIEQSVPIVVQEEITLPLTEEEYTMVERKLVV